MVATGLDHHTEGGDGEHLVTGLRGQLLQERWAQEVEFHANVVITVALIIEHVGIKEWVEDGRFEVLEGPCAILGGEEIHRSRVVLVGVRITPPAGIWRVASIVAFAFRQGEDSVDLPGSVRSIQADGQALGQIRLVTLHVDGQSDVGWHTAVIEGSERPKVPRT